MNGQITNFFNNSDEKKNATFENVAVKDKIVVLFSGQDPDSIIMSAEIFEEEVLKLQ
jgi:PHD/YefM family antitoxin component YafN of YafNO toxin-antitoxin module